MLLERRVLEGIRDGGVSLVFRRWRRPTVKAGGSLRTAVGVLAIDGVEEVDTDEISEAEAERAGFATLRDLLRSLDRRSVGRVYRVRVRFRGPDPRLSLREEEPEGDALEDLLERLDQMQRRGKGPTPARLLRLIGDRPATLAADLAAEVGMERDPFKRKVRLLKGLGLTESLSVGYRLSPRGRAVLAALDGPDEGPP